MRLDQALVARGLCESREEAKECIEKGYVLVDGCVVTKKTRQVHDDTKLEVTQTRKYVSRGGDKLEGALLYIYGNEEEARKNIVTKYAIDIGSSTGGFTDCLLRYGARRVTAVDVGTSQLHPTLRNHAHVALFEKTDIREFITEEKFDIVVADVSFISLEKILDMLISFGTSGTEYFLLIKPQFEVGFGNTKKGIVKDVSLVNLTIQKYTHLLTLKGLSNVTIFPCLIKGGDGNQEYFIYVKN